MLGAIAFISDDYINTDIITPLTTAELNSMLAQIAQGTWVILEEDLDAVEAEIERVRSEENIFPFDEN